jgi:hypothetical protein
MTWTTKRATSLAEQPVLCTTRSNSCFVFSSCKYETNEILARAIRRLSRIDWL